MKRYYANSNPDPNGYHKVHPETCDRLPTINSRRDLGYCSSCSEAVTKEKQYYIWVDGCHYCCPECHKH
jgi:hypothetical protein